MIFPCILFNIITEDLQGTNLFNKIPKQPQPPIPFIEIPSNNNSTFRYTIIVKKDIWKEINSIKTSGMDTGNKHALKYKRLFVKTATLT